MTALCQPIRAIKFHLHKWGRVLKTPAPWRPAQWTSRPDARDRLLPYALTPSMARKPEPKSTRHEEGPHGGN